MDPDGWWAELGYILYFGGMSGALLVGCGWLFDADQLVGHHPEAIEATLRVVAIAGALLVAHYALQGIRCGLLGHARASYLRELALPGILAEASLMPLGVVLVLLYDPDRAARVRPAVDDLPADQLRVRAAVARQPRARRAGRTISRS